MRLIFILLTFFPFCIQAQFHESFSDGELKTNPQWLGNVNHFIINTNAELQLNNADAGVSNLSTLSHSIENAIWQFRVKMDFNPSSSNFSRVYLASDTDTLSDANNALFIELGSTNDNICLYKIENGSKEKMIIGASDYLDVATIDVNVKITRTANDWTLEADMGQGWITVGQTTFEFNYPSSYFGLYCKYTKTRADKFYFDDIEVTGEPYTDKNPPVINSFELLNGTTMLLTFNENIDEASVQTDDFILHNSQRSPTSFVYNENTLTLQLNFNPILEDVSNEQLMVSGIDDEDGNSIVDTTFTFSYERIKLLKVKLYTLNTLELYFSKEVPIDNINSNTILIDSHSSTIKNITSKDQLNYSIELAEPLTNGQTYNLTVYGIIDAVGDEVPYTQLQIMHYNADRYDIVFNEWMADPSPSMGLPEVEYIELFNNSQFDIHLNNWHLQINDKTVVLPDSCVKAGEFICLVASSHQEEWKQNKNTAYIKNMPALNNTGCKLILINQNNTIIDAYDYSPTNIPGEGFKKDGGWSVERIDAKNRSASSNNFHWCMNLIGGTPGAVNSISEINTDKINPTIKQLTLVDEQSIQIVFSETMQFATIEVETAPEVPILQFEYDTVFLNQLLLHLAEPLTINTPYFLNNITISDLANNPLKLEEPLLFGIPDTLEHNDLLINEILFNPYPDGADFVELYNTSNKIINLKHVYFAEMEGEIIEKLHQASTETQLLLPHSYVAITTDQVGTLNFYQSDKEQNITETTTLPSYPDNEGHVAISNLKGIVLDEFKYNDKMHSDLLKDTEGVSLERQSITQATQLDNNWHSAASTVGYATPGYSNSQQFIRSASNDNVVSVEPEIFTPNGDGIDDRLYIHFNKIEQGALATIRIYNSMGTEVRYLVNNESLSDTGYFIWNGLSENNEILRPDIYIVYIQIVYSSGKMIEEKISCVIGIDNQ